MVRMMLEDESLHGVTRVQRDTALRGLKVRFLEMANSVATGKDACSYRLIDLQELTSR